MSTLTEVRKQVEEQKKYEITDDMVVSVISYIKLNSSGEFALKWHNTRSALIETPSIHHSTNRVDMVASKIQREAEILFTYNPDTDVDHIVEISYTLYGDDFVIEIDGDIKNFVYGNSIEAYKCISNFTKDDWIISDINGISDFVTNHKCRE